MNGGRDQRQQPQARRCSRSPYRWSRTGLTDDRLADRARVDAGRAEVGGGEDDDDGGNMNGMIGSAVDYQSTSRARQ